MEKKRKRAESGMPVNKKPKIRKRGESEKSPYKIIIGMELHVLIFDGRALKVLLQLLYAGSMFKRQVVWNLYFFIHLVLDLNFADYMTEKERNSAIGKGGWIVD